MLTNVKQVNEKPPLFNIASAPAVLIQSSTLCVYDYPVCSSVTFELRYALFGVPGIRHVSESCSQLT